MRIIHTVSWSTSEIESYRQLAFGNVLDGMRELLLAMKDELHIDVGEENEVSTTPNFHDVFSVSAKPFSSITCHSC